MATQYATTRVTYEYSIVHPSNADIRFIGYDNSSDGVLVLRVAGDNSSGQQALKIHLGGNLTVPQNKTYTAAFGIVNEERYAVDITNITVATTAGSDYMQIWLHSTPNILCENEDTPGVNSVMVWNKGSVGFDNSNCVWQLAAGNQSAEDMDTNAASGDTRIENNWEGISAHVRYSNSNAAAVNGTSDFVWVQISLDIPAGASAGNAGGIIFINFKADTN